MGVKNQSEFAINILHEMVRIPTIVPPGENYEEFVKLVREILKDVGLKTKILKVPKEVVKRNLPEMAEFPRYILLARIGSGRPVLHFNGHYDVVPASSEWDPFSPRVKGDRIFGRGTSDMKGGIAAIITAVKALIEDEVEITGSLEISLTPDEEIGGACGVGYLLSHIEAPNWAIVAEPSGCEKIWIGHKGVVWGEIEVTGKSAHASIPDEGKNAVEYCIKVAQSLLNLKSKVESRTTSLACNVKKATLEITQIGGGTKINVLPERAFLRFDRRVLPEEELENVVEELKRAVAPFDYRTLLTIEPFVNKNSMVALKINDALSKRGIKGVMAISSGFMDTRFFWEAGTDVVAFGPGELSYAHKSWEFVEIKKVLLAAEVLLELASELLKRS